VVIKEIAQLSYQISDVIENVCTSDSNGIISIAVQGGTGAYNINWNIGVGETISNLTNGLYFATITDANNCQKTTEVIQISSSSDIIISGQIIHDMNNSSTGEICLDIFGAIEPYQIKWINRPENSICITGLSAGIYEVEITDGLGCIISQAFEIENTSSTGETSINKFIIFPNPTNNTIKISGENDLIAVEIFSASGKNSNVITQRISSTQLSSDLSLLPPGMYFLKIHYNDGVSILKVVKI
jgi:hypothetical protein